MAYIAQLCWRDFSQRAKQDSRPGQAVVPGAVDRRRKLGRHGRRHQGRPVRSPAAKERRRHQERHEGKASERFKCYSWAELMARDKASLGIFWFKDDSLEYLDDLPPPDVLQQEIIDHLEAALTAFRDVSGGCRHRLGLQQAAIRRLDLLCFS